MLVERQTDPTPQMVALQIWAENEVKTCGLPVDCSHLLADGVDVGTADLVRPRDVVLEIDLLAEVHLAGDGGEDEALLTPVRDRELDLAVEAPRPQQRRVQRVRPVRRHDHLKATALVLR